MTRCAQCGTAGAGPLCDECEDDVQQRLRRRDERWTVVLPPLRRADHAGLQRFFEQEQRVKPSQSAFPSPKRRSRSRGA